MMKRLDPIEKNLIRGAATTLILLVLKDRPTHGYQIAQRIKARSADAFDFPEGTIYPLLYGLVDGGHIEGEWQEGNTGRQRKVYRITPAGRKELERRLGAWEKYANGMRVALRAV